MPSKKAIGAGNQQERFLLKNKRILRDYMPDFDTLSEKI